MSLVSGPGRGGFSDLPEELQLAVQKHVAYIVSLDSRKDEYEYWLTEHLRLNGLYWGLHALHLLGHANALPRAEVLDFVISCLHLDGGPSDGGFGAAPGHDAHMLYTVSGVQILALIDGFEDLERRVTGARDRIGRFLASLQDRTSGTFTGDQYGEADTRFLYGALNALSLLGLLHLIDVPLAVRYIESCANADGGYGTSPGAESHSGQIFVCVAALSIAGRLDCVDADRLAGWLSERQVATGSGVGGLNGRPEKKEDSCYSWWVLSPLATLKKLHWIDKVALVKFILGCQDAQNGGFSDRPGDAVDVFHTHFAVCGLSLLGYEGLGEVDTRYCLPKDVVSRYVKS